VGGKSTSSGSTNESVVRGFQPRARGLGDTTIRALLGQMAAPPETAISAPHQQAITGAQLGPAGMSQMFGIGATKSLTPGPNQYGLQSREQLGLPDRRDYFTFVPTPDQIEAMGALPGVRGVETTAKAQNRYARLGGKIEKATAAGKTKRADKLTRRREKIATHHPEIG